MRCLPPWALFSTLLLFPLGGCDETDLGNSREQGLRSSASPAVRSPGRLLVLRLGDGVQVLKQRGLPHVGRVPRAAPRHWKGLWEVRSATGQLLHRGRFRIPRRRHALFGEVDGPARAVDVPLGRPVVWLRVPLGGQAGRLVLYDDHGRRRLGEVAL